MLKLYTGLQTWWAELKASVTEERGATAVEYALMVALIAVVIILAVTFMGTSADDKFSQVGRPSAAPVPSTDRAASVGRSRRRPFRRRRQGPTALFGVMGREGTNQASSRGGGRRRSSSR